MRKFFMILFLCSFFVLFTGCGNKGMDGYHEISYNEFSDLVKNKESFPLVVGSSTCSACASYKPIMESFIKKYNVDVRYIDLSKLGEDEKNMILSDLNIQSTPTTLFIELGKQTSVYYRLVGAESLSNIINSFKRMGYIGEE